MDIYAENNGGFQVLEGTSPFEEGSQLQGGGYTEMTYQEPAAGPAWYGEAQGAEGLPAGAYQETVMQAGGYDNAQGAVGFPVGQYRETVMQTAGGGNMYGAENFPQCRIRSCRQNPGRRSTWEKQMSCLWHLGRYFSRKQRLR